ncbi:uncharacterized protein [Garra rufa]|uniref:uncharacterized protein n=1 Tax=Garra rufa TaxID=137080 RepID=UPI003CCEA54F
MADKCHLCLLGLIFLSSLLTGTSGVDDVHVFISSGENVRLPCNKALHDCKSTVWNFNNRHSVATVELIGLGIKKKDTESHERLSLGSDCSLNIKNITKEDYGSYTCQQWTGVNGQLQKQANDTYVCLHVLLVSSSSSQTEISPGSSVTLSCQMYSYSYAGVSCDYWIRSEGYQLFWVNQTGVKLTISDSRYQISASGRCIITLTTTLLNEDDNREWRCEVTHRNQVKASVTYCHDASEIVADTAGDTVTWKKKQVAKKRRLLRENNGHKQVSESNDDAESSEQVGNSAAVVMSVSDVVAKVVENENVTDVHMVEKDDDLDVLNVLKTV